MKDLTITERLKYGLIALIFILLLVSAVFEFRSLQNMLEPKILIGIFATIGLIIGGLIGHHFAKKTKDLVEKMRFYLLFIVAFSFLMPFFGSMTNRLLSFNNFENRMVELYQQKGFIADIGIIKGQNMQPDGYFTFVVIDGKLERLKSVKILYPNARKGDKVILKMKKGLYGFWIIKTE